MEKYIIITADTNDGDYVKSINKITEETFDKIKQVIEAIRNFKPYKSTSELGYSHNHNFATGECVRDDLGEKSAEDLYGQIDGFSNFEELLPYSEYGIHTIKSIEIIEGKLAKIFEK